MNENPYQSPVDSGISQQQADHELLPPIDLKRIVVTWFRWLFVCSVAAIPSFYFGLIVTAQCPYRIPAMLSGILLFATLFVPVELFVFRPWSHRKKDLYWALLIGYGLRMAASIVFPIGGVVDMFTGMLSITLFQPLIRSADISGQVLGIILTTITQGVLMNILVAAVVAFSYAILVLAKR